MIPIRDTLPSRRYPLVNNLLIGGNILFFILELTRPDLNRFLYQYGLVPARYSNDHISSYFTLWNQGISFITFMFLHGGFLHLLGNMWSLYIFGDNVEERMGPFRYLGFYLLCGLVSGITHLLFNLNANSPVIGASGAVAGVMGAYFLLYPHSRILALIPIFFIPWFIEVPAFIFLGVWFLFQFLSAAGSQGAASNVAWWAHIGGFIFGMVTVRLFLLFPQTGASQTVRRITEKQRSPGLQVVRPSGPQDSADLYGRIYLSPWETQNGVRKTINLPWGFQDRLVKVDIPPETQEGSTIRLRNMGRIRDDGGRGDLFLKVVHPPEEKTMF